MGDDRTLFTPLPWLPSLGSLPFPIHLLGTSVALTHLPSCSLVLLSQFVIFSLSLQVSFAMVILRKDPRISVILCSSFEKKVSVPEGVNRYSKKEGSVVKHVR